MIGHFPYATTPGTGLLLDRDTGERRKRGTQVGGGLLGNIGSGNIVLTPHLTCLVYYNSDSINEPGPTYLYKRVIKQRYKYNRESLTK